MTNNSISRRSVAAMALTGLTIAIVLTLLFTRFGVFLVFDVLADIGGKDTSRNTYSDAPVSITKVIPDPSKIDLPPQIEQVSGILKMDDTLVMSTDQSELFMLDMANPAKFKGGSLFPYTPLLMRQGRLEAVAWTGETYRLVGEYGAFLQVDPRSDQMVDRPLPSQIAGFEFSGLATGPEHFYFTSDGMSEVTVLNRSTDQVEVLNLDFGMLTNPQRGSRALKWSGIAYADGLLYLTADAYPLVVVASATSGTVLDVIGIEGELQFSDIAIDDGTIYLPRDHNYFDKRPPVLVFDLESAEAPGKRQASHVSPQKDDKAAIQ